MKLKSGFEFDETTPAGAELLQVAEQSEAEKQGLAECRNCGHLTPKKTLAIYHGNCQNCNYE